MPGNGRVAETFEYISALLGLITQSGEGLGLDLGSVDVKFEPSYCIPVLLGQADELNSYLTGLR